MTAKPSVTRVEATESANLVPTLLSISKCVRQLVGIKLAECDVVVGQDQFLLCFAKNEILGSIQLANRLSVRPSTVSKMVDILERKGWVTRTSDDGDHRRVLLQLTKEGESVAEKVRVLQESLESELMSAIGSGEEMLNAIAELDNILARRLRRLR